MASSLKASFSIQRTGSAMCQTSHGSLAAPPASLLRPRRVRRSGAAREAVRAAYVPPSTQAPPNAQQQLNLELPTADFRAVQLTSLRRKKGGTAILVQDVPAGSAAAEAGVLAGQQLLAISDPIRANEVWELNALASLKYVKQAVDGRALTTLTVRLTSEPVPEWQAAMAAMRSSMSSSDSDGEQLSGDEKAELLRQLQSMDKAAQGAKKAARDEKLERRAALQQENVDQQRSSTPFFVAFIVLFLGLPAGVVLLALSSGYLDTLGPR